VKKLNCPNLPAVLNIVLHDIVVPYFNMNTTETKLSQSRFGTLIFLFRMAGIPVQMKRRMTINIIYMVTVTICSCSTYIGMLVDVYMHRDDLGRAMTAMHMLIPVTNVMWTFSYCSK
jgi:hypothetical protein